MNKYSTSVKRMRHGKFCPRINRHLKESAKELINQLDSLINENDIELATIRQMGLLETVRGDSISYKPSAITFELQLLRNFKIKEKVIDNMLFASNLLDHSTMMIA